MDEKDERQLRLMKRQLQHFSEKELDLNGLIGDLDFLLLHAEGIDASWKREVSSHIMDLEEINAWSRDDGKMTQEDWLLVAQSAAKISALVEDQLAKVSAANRGE
jgi:hypothetical protein